MKLLRTALVSLILASALPLAHAQDRYQDRDHDRDHNNVVARDHDHDRDMDRERFREHDAAYQDGWKKGMEDGQKRHKSKIKYGHWKNNDDRSAFAEGYNRGYRSYYSNDRHDRDHDNH